MQEKLMKAMMWVGIFLVFFVALGLIISGGENSNSDVSETSSESTTKESKSVLEVLNSDVVNEEFGSYIVGTIRNNSNKNLLYAQVEINLYDESGAQVGSTLDNINNLEAGGTWKFKAMVMSEGASKYKIKDVTGY